MSFKKGIEVVAGAIIENDRGQILLTRSPKWHNKWTLPGGHIEPGERVIAAGLREIKEETGLKIKPVRILKFGELINSKDFHRPAHFIYFDIIGKTAKTKIKLDNKELTSYIWTEPRKALKMDLAESYKESILEYIAYKKRKAKK